MLAYAGFIVTTPRWTPVGCRKPVASEYRGSPLDPHTTNCRLTHTQKFNSTCIRKQVYLLKVVPRAILRLHTSDNRCILYPMLRRLNIWLDSADLKRLAVVAKKSTPGTKVSMLIRQAISEFLDKHEGRKAA
jgi:hypothetical protein